MHGPKLNCASGTAVIRQNGVCGVPQSTRLRNADKSITLASQRIVAVGLSSAPQQRPFIDHVVKGISISIGLSETPISFGAICT